MKLNNNINRILLKEQSFPTYNINNNLILYPGKKEKITSKKRLKTGIPIDRN